MNRTMKFLLTDESKYPDLGLLIVRIGIGLSMLLFHGYGKIMGGPERWERLGGQMHNVGITFLPVFWGFMAGFAEFFGSIFLMLGVLYRPAAGLLIATMFVAAMRHLNLPPEASGAGWSGASHALELLTIYLGLFLIGPGKYRLGGGKIQP